jgi:hypothetical protein
MKRLPRVAWSFGMSVALLCLTTAARADSPPEESSGLVRCAGIAAPAARLACYDALAGRAPEPAAATADLSAPATTHHAPAHASAATANAQAALAAAAADPANFGLDMAHVERAERVPDAPTSVRGEVKSVSQGGGAGGRGTVQLDNGQVWQFTESGADGRVRVGDTVTIKRAALGSFLLVPPSKRSFHVRRIR